MTPGGHPSYSNPTLQEAICEIAFTLPDGASWNPLWFAEFFKQVQSEFPVFELVPIHGMPIGIGQTAVTVPLAQTVRYRAGTRPLILQLSENRLSISHLPVYPGWERMVAAIEYAWNKAKEVITPARIVRIGLRYINRIERASPHETLGTWLRPTDYVPAAVLHSLPGFIAQIQTRIDEYNRFQVIIGEQASGPNVAPAFIFDIDRILERDLSLETSSVVAETTRLHEDVWDVFKAATGERLEKLLSGELL